MDPSFAASHEFGFGFDNVVPISGASSSTGQVPTTLAGVEQTVSGEWYRHPSLALFLLVGATAVLIEKTTRPAARARVEGNVGPAKGEIEGEI